MKTKILTIALLFVGLSVFGQSITDQNGSFWLNMADDTVLILKPNVEDIRNDGDYVRIVITSSPTTNSTPGYYRLDPDDYAQFSTANYMISWLKIACSPNQSDYIKAIGYNALNNPDSVFYFISDTLKYTEVFIDNEPDGNIDTIKTIYP